MDEYLDGRAFSGDASEMPIEARRIAIKLKTGAPITSVSKIAFSDLMEFVDDVRLSLNNDLLDLYVDERNEVAWAVRPDGVEEASLLSASTLRRDDVNMFISVATLLTMRRQLGNNEPDTWLVTKDELLSQFVSNDPSLKEETRGERVARKFEQSISQAKSVSYSWVADCGDGRYQILPTVSALLDLGFHKLLSTSLEGLGTTGDNDVE